MFKLFLIFCLLFPELRTAQVSGFGKIKVVAKVDAKKNAKKIVGNNNYHIKKERYQEVKNGYECILMSEYKED